MKKFIALALVLVTMVLMLAACGSKPTAEIAFTDVEDCEVFAVDSNGAIIRGDSRYNLSKNLNVVTITVNKDGTYFLKVNTDDGEFNFQLTHENGKFTAEADSGLNFTLTAKSK